MATSASSVATTGTLSVSAGTSAPGSTATVPVLATSGAAPRMSSTSPGSGAPSSSGATGGRPGATTTSAGGPSSAGAGLGRLSEAELRGITDAVLAAIRTSTPEVPAPGAAGLPVDPGLTPEGGEVPFPCVSALAAVKDSAASSLSLSATSLVAEGLPPIPTKLVEKIRRWEFVDLALLLQDASSKSEELLLQQHGSQIMIIQSVEQAQKRKRQIVDIVSWVRAFSIYSAVLAAAEETTKEEVVGLLAHTHLMTQLAKDLGGGQWLSYDVEFREWAAAKGVRKWGELNLIIYGRCLSGRIPWSQSLPTAPHSQPTPTQKPNTNKRPKAQKVCFRWNFSPFCDRAEGCRFAHTCYHCGDTSHKGQDCGGSKRSKRDRTPPRAE